MNDENTITLWVARAWDGHLQLFQNRPVWDEPSKTWNDDENDLRLTYLSELKCPKLTFENSPQTVTLSLANIE